MTRTSPSKASLSIRPIQYRDIDQLGLGDEALLKAGDPVDSLETAKHLERFRRWYGPLKFLSLFPNPLQHLFSVFVAEQENQICGLIQVSPFNRTRTTWQVNRVVVNSSAASKTQTRLLTDIGSQLLRYCFEKIWEARTWLIEVNVNNNSAIALYRQNGFQPLAQVTYWSIAPSQLEGIASREADLPNLLPVSNVDAKLLYQLDTAAMPPLVRQVFDHQLQDFQTNLLQSLTAGLTQWLNHTETVSAYVFEPQRKAAIGHFKLQISRNGAQPHVAQLTVHPAYTWLYPELLSQMARVVQSFPAPALCLTSLDYQPEREAYLSRIGAARIEHSLMMSRSVWHKLRESKPMSLEGLQLSDVLPGLQTAGKPIPGRMSLSIDMLSSSHYYFAQPSKSNKLSGHPPVKSAKETPDLPN